METKKILSVLFLASFAILSFAFIATAFPALAQTTVLVGNDTAVRTQLDTASNFTVVDTNHPAIAVGSINQFEYYASNTNPFEFVLVNGSNVVQWISPMITPNAVGANIYTPTSLVPVQAGWNLGVYFSSTGTIPFENTGATASWTAAGSGAPITGSTLSIAGSGARIYSFVGESMPVLTSVTVSPTTETLNVGGTQQLTANPIDQNSAVFSGANLSYMSSNTAIATVSTTGMVTAVSAGSATITVTATSGATSVSATSAVTVNGSTNNGNGNGNTAGGNLADDLRIRIILDMIRRLLAQLGITESFTASNGLTF